jgi:nucleoside-diphosphate-sugar epimerase
MASTSSLYAGQPLPFIESANVDMPISPYAASKRAAELLLYTYHLQYGLDVTILRYFTVYGPLGRPDMAPYRFAKWILEGRKIQIYGSGSHARDFTYIDDIVEGTILARKPLGYEIINLGGGKDPVSLLDFISAIEIVLEKKANLEFLEEKRGDMLLTQADISKAKTVLSWSPKVDVLAGIRLMCETKSDFIYSEDTI